LPKAATSGGPTLITNPLWFKLWLNGHTKAGLSELQLDYDLQRYDFFRSFPFPAAPGTTVATRPPADSLRAD